MKKSIFILCINVLFIFLSQSQTMVKTPLKIPEMRCRIQMKVNANPSTITLIDMDDDNYYFHLIEKISEPVNTTDSHSILLVNKYLTNIQKKSFWVDNSDS